MDNTCWERKILNDPEKFAEINYLIHARNNKKGEILHYVQLMSTILFVFT